MQYSTYRTHHFKTVTVTPRERGTPMTDSASASREVVAVAAAIKLQALVRGNKGRQRALSRIDELISNVTIGMNTNNTKNNNNKKKKNNNNANINNANTTKTIPTRNKTVAKKEWPPPPPPPQQDPKPSWKQKQSIDKKTNTETKDATQETTTKSKKKWWGGKKKVVPAAAPVVESKKEGVGTNNNGTTIRTNTTTKTSPSTTTDALKPPVATKEVLIKTEETNDATKPPQANEKNPMRRVDNTTTLVAETNTTTTEKRDTRTEGNTHYGVAKPEPVSKAAAAKTEATANNAATSKSKSKSYPKPPVTAKPDEESASARSAPPKKKARTHCAAVGVGTRIWIKQSAVDAIRKPKGFQPGVGFHQKQKRLLKKTTSNASQSSDDSSTYISSEVEDESAALLAVIKRSTKWLWKQGSLVDSTKKTIVVSLDEDDSNSYNESPEGSSGPLELPTTAMTKGDVVMANDYRLTREGRPICPDDLISLTHLHEPSVVECLEHRYNDNRIYTSTGPILLALNPFKRIDGLYEDDTMKQYWRKAEIEKESGESRLPPHIYAIADNAFMTMMRQLVDPLGGGEELSGCDQSILVSGESGAGKTVTTKFAMKYLAALSQRKTINLGQEEEETEHSYSTSMNDSATDLRRPSSLRRMSSHLNVTSSRSLAGEQESIESQVLQSNPILESFGNARTIRNDNSSRFGKFIEMQFTRKGRLVGASIEAYLLEKVRLVKASPGERNYHIFYELLEGDMPKSERKQYFLDSMATPEDFKVTATGTYTRRDGVTDDETYDDLMLAMHSMGFPKEEQTNIFTTVAAILHASNLTFLDVDVDATSKLDADNAHLQPACSLFGVTPEDLGEALCHVTLSAGNKSTLKKDLTVDKAIKGLEALLKTTYGTLFTYLVTRVNEKVSYKRKRDETNGDLIYNPKKDAAASIGVLDIFGFESFQVNSFEQLCINYCNEALQQQFNTFVIENEQAEYEREGINWSFIEFPENQDVLDLIGKKGTGLISILDDQCKTPGTTDKSFAFDLYKRCQNHVRFSADLRQSAQLKFSIHHYAGAVEYTADGFVEKNRDELPKEATDLLKNSSNPFIRLLAGIIESSTEKAAVNRTNNAASENKPKKTKETVGGEFHRQLRHLRQKIDKMTPHYVRCLKPNDELVQNCFDKAAIVEQVRCGGIIEAVRVARAGFSNQFSHPDFVRRYSTCVWKELKKRRVKPRRARGGAASPLKKSKKGPRKITSRECSDLMKLLCKKLQEKDDDEDENSDGEDNDSNNKKEEEEKETNVFKQKAKKAIEDTSGEMLKVGLQFGKTKVFVRHTAFENLERIRTQEQSKAAVKLNSIFRMALVRREYSSIFHNTAHKARIAAIMAENPDWEDPTFGKETLDRYEKNRDSFTRGGNKFKKSQNNVGKLNVPSIFK